MIEAHDLVKRYGSTMAVNDLVLLHPARPGYRLPRSERRREDTTMRMILGLDAPTPGSVTVGGRSYRDLLGVRDDDEEVDVAPVVRVSAAEGADECRGADRRVSFETLDRPDEPRLADRTELWRCGNLRVGAHRSPL